MPRVILTSQHHRTAQDLLSQPGKSPQVPIYCVLLFKSLSHLVALIYFKQAMKVRAWLHFLGFLPWRALFELHLALVCSRHTVTARDEDKHIRHTCLIWRRGPHQEGFRPTQHTHHQPRHSVVWFVLIDSYYCPIISLQTFTQRLACPAALGTLSWNTCLCCFFLTRFLPCFKSVLLWCVKMLLTQQLLLGRQDK